MNNLVEISKNKQAVTTSIRVAEVFGKRHDRVLRGINQLVGDLHDIEDFGRLTFEPSKFSHPKNGAASGVKNNAAKIWVSSYKDAQGKCRKQYVMNRDGFTLLAMGFTGKKALEFKIKYINAFNEMEAKLRAMYPCGAAAVGKPGAGNEVAVREHTRSLPVCRKKEIVLSEKAKTEIGGIVKAVVCAELAKVNKEDIFGLDSRVKPENDIIKREPEGDIIKRGLEGDAKKQPEYDKTGRESWEVSDADLLRHLHNWYATKHKQTTLSAQKVICENNRLSEENRELQRRLNLISQVLG